MGTSENNGSTERDVEATPYGPAELYVLPGYVTDIVSLAMLLTTAVILFIVVHRVL